MKYGKIVLPRQFSRVMRVLLPIFIIIASPGLLYYLSGLAPYETLIPYFERFSWTTNAFVAVSAIVTSDLIATALCLVAAFWLFRGRRRLFNRHLYALSLYCIICHCILSLFDLILATKMGESVLAYLAADLAAVLILIACIWAGRCAYPSPVRENRIISLLCLMVTALFLAAALGHFVTRFHPLRRFDVYDMFFTPEPIRMIASFFNLMTQGALEKIVYPEYLSSIRTFYNYIFPYWALAFFGAMVFMAGKPAREPLSVTQRPKTACFRKS